MKQYQKLIVHFINKQEYKLALKMLNKIESAETRNYEMIKYASILIKKASIDTFKALESENFRTVDIPKLMPALMGCPDRTLQIALDYVKNHCIKLRQCRDSSVHNMNFYLHSK